MRIVISGAGVAGPALAYWLLKGNHEIIMVEKAPKFRNGGYIIDFWGLGYDICEKMGLIDEIIKSGYKVKNVIFRNIKGNKTSEFSIKSMHELTKNRFTSLPRGELAQIIYDSVKDKITNIFDDNIEQIIEDENKISLTLKSGKKIDADLLIGADGVHSNVRNQVFGSPENFERDLGYIVAAVETDQFLNLDENIYYSDNEENKSIGLFKLKNGKQLNLFIFTSDLLQGYFPINQNEKLDAIKNVFSNINWEGEKIFSIITEENEIYFDNITQIEMPKWHKGRVALIGDAVGCVSLLAGEGTGLGITEAYILAGELKKAKNDYSLAFENYENHLTNFIKDKQKTARAFATNFVPSNKFEIIFRDIAINMMCIPYVAKLIFKKTLTDDFILPEY